jgi:hypothetical protein
VLTKERLVYVGPGNGVRKAALGASPSLRVAARPLPGDAFAPGPGEVPVAGPALGGALQRLLAEVAVKMTAASLVVPDGFAKLLSAEIEEAERNPRETEEVLAWKFGRAFGEPAPPLRLSWQAAGPASGGTRILALAAPEAAAASWEAPFEKAGIRVGALETSALAVSSLARLPAGDAFLVWADGDTATSLFFTGGALRFARTRPVWSDVDEALHEIRLAASYVTGDGGTGELGAPGAAGPPGAAVVEALQAFRREKGLAPAEPLSLAALVPAATVAPLSAAADPATLAGLGALAGGR